MEVCGNEWAGHDDAVEQAIDRTTGQGLYRNHIQYFDDHFSFSKYVIANPCYNINSRNGSATYYMHPLRSINSVVAKKWVVGMCVGWGGGGVTPLLFQVRFPYVST